MGFVINPSGSTSSSSSTGVLLPSGKFVQVIPSINGGGPLTLNREYVLGVMLAPQTIDRIALNVTTAGSVGAVARVGVRNDADGVPGTVAAQGTLDATVTGWQALTVSIVHPGGVFWYSVTGQGWATTAPLVDNRGATSAGALGVTTVSAAARAAMDWSAGHTPLVGYQDSVSGSLGSTFTNAAVSSQSLITLTLRRA